MILNFILVLISATIFLFSLHYLSKDDFTLLRKNITLEQIFNLAFLSFIVSIFSSRLFFVLLHFKKIYLNPLVFLHIVKYPGLSLYGGIIGAAIFLYMFLKRKKVPLGRIFDIFSLAFLTTLPLSIIHLLLTKTLSLFLFVNFTFFLLYIFTIYLFIKLFLKGQTKPGIIGIYVFSLFSAVSFIQNFFVKQGGSIFIFSWEQIFIVLFALVLLTSFFFRKAH